MARFFFHFFNGESRSEDELGLELAGAEEAYIEAAEAARGMWPELLAARCDPRHCAFEIEGEDGAGLFRLSFSELLDDCRGAAVRPARPSEVLLSKLHETHRRATSSRSDLRRSFDEIRRALDESSALLARISAFERRHAPIQPGTAAASKSAGKPD